MIKRIILVQNLAEKRWLTVNSLDTNLKKKKNKVIAELNRQHRKPFPGLRCC